MSEPASVLRVVGIDTATRSGAVALVEFSAGGAAKRLAEVAHEEELRHAETLLPAVDGCLDRAECALSEVDGFAVSIGPGSFTGLRVGLATAKGLALATDAWLVGVPTLEAYARTDAAHGGLIFVCLDARKGEVYSALFVVEGAGEAISVRRLLDDAVAKPDVAIARLAGHLGSCGAIPPTLRVVGDGGERYPAEIVDALGRAGPVEVAPCTASGRGFAVAELGGARFRDLGPADTDYLAPTYLRASEAELKLRERRSRGPESH